MPRNTSESESSSESEMEFEDMKDVLNSLKLRRKYWKQFKKANLVEFDDCKALSDSKLKKLGVSSTDRKKILNILEDLVSDSESEYDYDTESEYDSDSSQEDDVDFDDVAAKLKEKGLNKAVKMLKKNNLDSYDRLVLINSRKLKKIGLTSQSMRDKVLKVIRSFSKGRGDYSDLSSDSISSEPASEKDIILQILRDNGFGSLQTQFIMNAVTTFDAAENLADNKESLKEMGLFNHNIVIRLRHMFKGENLAKYKKEYRNKKPEVVDNLLSALKRVKMEKHLDVLKDNDICTVREAQKLDDDKLLDLGIKNEGQRALIIECMAEADWKCIHCNAWNEHRKTCLVCQRTHRVVTVNDDDTGNNFEIGDKIKYIGKSRPQTKTYAGAKGEIHRVLENGNFYMVKFSKSDNKTVKIRLAKEELKARKK